MTRTEHGKKLALAAELAVKETPAMSTHTPAELRNLRQRMKYTNCGCRFVDLGNPQYGQGDVHWIYCPLHAQAPAMREALKAIIYASDHCQGHRNCEHSMEPWKDARALLAQIEKG